MLLTITELSIIAFTTIGITLAVITTVVALTHTLATLTDAMPTAHQRAVVRLTGRQHFEGRVRITLLHTLALLTQIPFVTATVIHT